MSHTTKASPKPSFRAPWKVGHAVIDNVEEWTSLPMPELLTMASRNNNNQTTKLEEDLGWIVPLMSPPTTQTVKALN